MTRKSGAPLLAALLLCLAAPEAGAAPLALKVPVPASGDVTVANVALKGTAARLRTPAVKNRAALGAPLTVVGGLRKLGAGKLLATVVVVRRDGGAPGATSVALSLRGVRRGRVTRKQVAESVLGSEAKPPYCASLPSSFAHAKLLFGKGLGRFSAAEVAEFGSLLRCKGFARQNEFVASFRSDGGEGVAPLPPSGGSDAGGNGPGAETECGRTESESACGGEEQQGPKIASNLHASGSATRSADDPRRFGYSISFNEPIVRYQVAFDTVMYCPASVYAAWYDTCPSESTQPGYGLRCEQGPSSKTTDFDCMPRSAEDQEPPQIPAGSVINGAFVTDPSRPPSSATSVRIVGFKADGSQSSGDAIPIQ